MYLLSAVCLMMLLYVILNLLLHGYRQFHRYHTTIHFLCAHGHYKGPSAVVALELCTLSDIIHVHIAHLHIPITLLSVHETNHNEYYIFEICLFQRFKLRRIVQGNYLARVIAFQNGYMIPLSRIQVCNHTLPVTPDNPRVAAAASCASPVMTSSGLNPLYAIYHATESVHNEPNSDSGVTPSPTVTVHAPMDTDVITHLKSGIWTSLILGLFL